MTRRVAFQIAALLVVLALCAAAVLAFRGLGRWLIREDALAPAAVVVVLSGGLPARAEEAARIYQLGDAPQVWVTRPAAPSAELAAMGIEYLGEEYFSREVLRHNGVPENAVVVLPEPIGDTQQEVEEISAELKREGLPGAILVTSPQHTRRVRMLWQKLVGSNPRPIVRAAPRDSFDAVHWWRNTKDALAVVRELLGLANARMGFPVRAQSR